MKEVLSPQLETVRAPLPLEMRVAICLYKLGSCCEYRLVANQFGVAKSTVQKIIYLFCEGMMSSVAKEFIRVPTTREARAIAKRFEDKFHIPQVIGCIDGSHIPVLAPKAGYTDFQNRKGWTSYILQAVVDDKYW